MAFYLFKKMGVTKRFHLNETKLARFLIHIEEGYPQNPYHCRTHAADVLRLLHVVLNRGGVVQAVAGAAQARSLLTTEERAGITNSAPAPLHEKSDDLTHIPSAQDLVRVVANSYPYLLYRDNMSVLSMNLAYTGISV